MALPLAAMAIDIICMIGVMLGGAMVLATGAGIALYNETNIPEKARRLDDYITSGVMTLVARFFEGWPKASSQLKAIFSASLALALIAAIVWIVSQLLE